VVKDHLEEEAEVEGVRSLTSLLLNVINATSSDTFKYKCPSWDKEANYVELDEKVEMLLMSVVEENEVGREDVCCGDKTLFSNLNESFRQMVKLGNNMKMSVMGKGNVRLQVSEFVHVITEVFFVPELRNNLLSIG